MPDHDNVRKLSFPRSKRPKKDRAKKDLTTQPAKVLQFTKPKPIEPEIVESKVMTAQDVKDYIEQLVGRSWISSRDYNLALPALEMVFCSFPTLQRKFLKQVMAEFWNKEKTKDDPEKYEDKVANDELHLWQNKTSTCSLPEFDFVKAHSKLHGPIIPRVIALKPAFSRPIKEHPVPIQNLRAETIFLLILRMYRLQYKELLDSVVTGSLAEDQALLKIIEQKSSGVETQTDSKPEIEPSSEETKKAKANWKSLFSSFRKDWSKFE